jgi:dienelactone hydrolase
MLAAMIVISGQSPLPGRDTDLHTAAKTFIELLHQGEFDAAAKSFDAAMLKELPPAKLKAVWESLIKNAGEYQRQLGVRSEPVGKSTAVFVTCQFAKSKRDARIVFDPEKHIAGLRIFPTPDYKPPPYVRIEAFHERDITVGSGDWVLPGNLTMPVGDGPFPAVVLVHGSGPNDRDESVLPGPNKPFKDLAWGLASRGIAVVRYEKRTRHYGQKIVAMKDTVFTIKDEVDDDALFAVRLLRETPGIDGKKVFVAGHSLGGVMAPRIAARDKDLAGLIILAANTRPIDEVTLQQLDYIAASDSKNPLEIAAIAKLKNDLERLKDPQISPKELIMGAPVSYWRELRDYHQGEVAAQLQLPILILQGERDYQVTMADFVGWQKALAERKNVIFKSYPTLNHHFISGAGKPNRAEYLAPGQVAEPVIADIAEWIKGR